MMNVLIMQTLLMKPFLSVMAMAPNDCSVYGWYGWSDQKMTDGGRKLTGIGIKKSSDGYIIAIIRAR